MILTIDQREHLEMAESLKEASGRTVRLDLTVHPREVVVSNFGSKAQALDFTPYLVRVLATDLADDPDRDVVVEVFALCDTSWAVTVKR